MASSLITQGDTRAFLQLKVGGQVHLIPAAIGDISEGLGAVNPVYHQGTSRGAYRLVNTTRDTPDLVTVSATVHVTNKQKFIDSITCNSALYVVGSKCLNPELRDIDPTGVIMLIDSLNVVDKTLSAPTDFEGQEQRTLEVNFTAGITVVPRFYYLTRSTVTTAVTTNATSVAAINKACASKCSAQIDALEVYYVATEPVALATAKLLYRSSANVTPSATSADPFLADEIISSVKVVPVTYDKVRVIVARGSTDAGNPAEIAYADVKPSTPDVSAWTTVNIGSTNAEFLAKTGSMVALANGVVLAGTDQGKLHKSIDYGATWSDLNSPTSAQINAIKQAATIVGPIDNSTFAMVANSNAIYTTNDTGGNWTAVTGPSAQAGVDANDVHAFCDKKLWVGYADGELYNTTDGGDNWTQYVLPKPAGFSTIDNINRVEFASERIGVVAGMATDGSSDEFGVVWKTIDGGASWEIHQEGTTYSEASPTGVNDIVMAGFNHYLWVGDEVGSTTSIRSLTAGDKE
jgi:photosystem II stability/assembly factor-like uncharacterized protein